MVIIVKGASLGRSQLALKWFNVALPRIELGQSSRLALRNGSYVDKVTAFSPLRSFAC
jgi:hypothetical protein